MPIYDYECKNCGIERNVWARMDEQEKLCPTCCNEFMTRIISSPDRGRFSISPDMAPYWDENLGAEPVYVESRKHRRQLMAQRDLVDKWTSKTRQTWI